MRLSVVALAFIALAAAGCSSAPPQPTAAAQVSSTPAASPSPSPTIPDTRANQAACNEFAKEQRGQITLHQFWVRLQVYGNQLSDPLVLPLAGFYEMQLFGSTGRAQQDADVVRELCASIGITA
jgi:hypothetical protein